MMCNRLDLRNHTTFKIGGATKYFWVSQSNDDLLKALMWCNTHAEDWFFLGNGSNILISDKGFSGLIITLGSNYKYVLFEGNKVCTGAGLLLPALSRHCMATGWGGFEFMCGIPGTVGGAVRINAGTKQGEIKDNFISATVLTPDGEIKILNKTDMEFDYRHSRLANTRDIIISAAFSKSCDSDKSVIKEKVKAIIASRRRKQPKNRRNCGSVFKQPRGGQPAGWYIDQAGLKGLRIGDAMIAHEHANWIVNLGNARAIDVKNIIETVQGKILRQFGILLERELIYVPEDIL